MPDWFELGALGLGGAGTAFGIYDLIRARQAQADRERQMQSILRAGPGAYMPSMPPEAMAAYMRTPAADLSARVGDVTGGYGTQVLADAAYKNWLDRWQQGAGAWQGAMAGVAGIPFQQPAGDVGGIGKAMALAMLARAMRGGQPTPPPSTAVSGTPGIGEPYEGYNQWGWPGSSGRPEATYPLGPGVEGASSAWEKYQ